MPIIGIDLGTSNSLVGYFSEEGPRLIPNALGELLTPSVVSVGEEGEVWVGKVAKERLVTHPECTVDVFKRYMGSTKKVQLGKHVFLPEELSSFVVRALKEDAEHYLGETITEAVISVPAYFNDIQRKATRRAGELAGLKVERIINEPTAAAIAYGMHEEEDDTKFLVFDLGGGTFDVSLLELFDGVMEVRAVAGDNYLGGHDFTDILFRDMLEKNNLKQETLSRKQLAILSKEAERLKVQLSTQDKVSMTYEMNEKQTLHYELSLKEYTKMCEPLLTRLRRPIERTISDADVRTNEIDNIVLVGGATKLPIIRDFVSKLFGRLPDFGINPDETIAVGATIQAGMKERHKMIKEVILTDVCPYTLGVGVKGSSFTGELEFSPIIERNMIIPTSRVESYQTIADNQTEVSIKVYQGESIYVKNNILLGEVLCKVPKNKAGMELMDVRFTYDINGLLEVETTVKSTKEKQIKLIKKPEGNISDYDLQERLKYLQTLKIHPRDQEEIKLIFARAERLYEESLGQKRDYIASCIRAFEEIVDSQNMMYVKKEAVKLSAKLDELETDRGL